MFDAVVIGGGHAGLAVSQRLATAGADHIVLERGDVGETWRAQRWDSFKLNTPNVLNRLPGGPDVAEPDGFATRDEWTAQLESYVEGCGLPVRTHANVTSVVADGDSAFVLTIADGENVRARNVVVASGVANNERLPAAAASIDRGVETFSTGTYRRPAQLPDGSVLVIGSAQSGCQIAEDLLDAGRMVYLSTGRVGRAPRRLRGRDTLAWLAESGWMTQRPKDLEDRAVIKAAQPQISGVGPRGHTVSLQLLAERGVTLLGHLEAVDGTRMRFADDLADHVRRGDEMSARIRRHVDEYLGRSDIDAVPSEPDPADQPVDESRFHGPTELDLVDRGIRSVIFSTGFGADYSWLRLPTFDSSGELAHTEGRSAVDGLWFVGLLWMRMRWSGIILGAMADSAHIVEQILRRRGHQRTP